jgi:hypothetical protein
MLTVEDSLFMIISGASSASTLLVEAAAAFPSCTTMQLVSSFLYYKFFLIQDLENCILALLSFDKGDIYGSVERKGEWLMWPSL